MKEQMSCLVRCSWGVFPANPPPHQPSDRNQKYRREVQEMRRRPQDPLHHGAKGLTVIHASPSDLWRAPLDEAVDSELQAHTILSGRKS
jgi:hypothetical protein